MQRNDYPNIGESIFSAQLPNGLELRVIPKKGFNTFYALIAADYGGAHRRFTVDGEVTDTPAGVAHFLEHKMFDLPGGDSALNILSINGADPNAFTSSEMTCYYFECTHSFEENLRILLHFVSTPYFTAETVQKEQGIIAQEIRMGDDSPGSAVYYNLLKLLYAHHPIRDKVAGTEESIAQITEKTLYDCHKVFYAPCNMCLCVEGDVEPQRIYDIAAELLPGDKLSKPKADFGPEESLLPAEKYMKVNMPVSAPQFLIGAKLKAPEKGADTLRQLLVSQLALRTLIGSSSDFYARLYADGLLNRDFGYEADFGAGTGSVIIGGESREPEKVLEALNAAVSAVKTGGLDMAAFMRSKKASIGGRLRGLEDFENVCISAAVGAFNGYCPFDAPAVLEDIIIEECEQFICENLDGTHLAVSVIGAGKEQ